MAKENRKNDREYPKEDQKRFRKLWEKLYSMQPADREDFARFVEDTLPLERLINESRRNVEEVFKNIPSGIQLPNLARCVLAIMEELKAIGEWDGRQNTTYETAGKTSRLHSIAETKRVQYLAAKTIYERARAEYEDEMMQLVVNLTLKTLSPLTKTESDPLEWFLTGEEIIELSGINISFSTLRRYQKQGLIPKPIRLGRKAYYSLLTIHRIIIIDKLKREGYILSDIKGALEPSLKALINKKKNKFPPDRTWWEDTLVIMTWIILLEESVKEIYSNKIKPQREIE